MTDKIAQQIKPIDIEDEMKESYLSYAMSVIVSRALPDVRDGLKPSQRRVLYAMQQLRLGPTAQHRKCAKIAGDTSGNYHPHGEAVVYPTLVRMAQDWNMRYPLVDGHGNFGSVDGDPPAAMRYTEARMSEFGAEMMADLDKETVDFRPNYDNTDTEPVVLPGRFPNLICNGTAGIAVGMATEIPPHNLGEVVDALSLLIENPETTLDEIMEVLPGPDFPTGGLILGTTGIRDAYEHGRGAITVQARATIEPADGGKANILITELPYQVNKARLIEHIADLVREKKLVGISAINDISDRTGMRVVIELKRETNPHVVLNYLYKHTPMRTTFGVISLALVSGAPRILTLKDLLTNFLEHRRVVITRRTQFELAKAEDRAHILEGYRVALRHLDEVIQIIKESPSPAVARERLVERFKLSERQANAILELLLRQLTALEQKKIEDEYRELLKQINYLREVLENPRKVLSLIQEELARLRDKYGDARRTRIRAEEASEINIEDLIAEEDIVITVTRDGYIKRMPVDTYRTQGRGGKGVIALSPKEEDVVEHLFVASTHHTILFFSNRGRVYRLKAHEVPAASRQARGAAIINLIQIEPGDLITATRTIKGFRDDQYLVMGTERGVIKKTRLSQYDTKLKGGIIAIDLDEGDELKWVKVTDGKQELMMTTELGISIRFPEAQVRSMARATRGVRGIRLRPGDRVVCLEVVRPEADLLVIGRNGYGKRTALSEYRHQARGGKGILTMRVTEKTGKVVDAKVVEDDDQLMVITAEGTLIRCPVGNIRRTGRAAQGVRIIRLHEGDQVSGVARVVKKEDEEAVAQG